MATATLKGLHAYLRLLENPSDLKRKMPGFSSPRTMKEGLADMGMLIGVGNVALKDPQNIAALIGSQRFVMIWGEPSVTTHVARVFDISRVLLTVLIGCKHSDQPTVSQLGPNSGKVCLSTGGTPLSASSAQSNSGSEGAWVQPKNDPDHALQNLNPLLAGKTALTCRLFRVLFEHMLGNASQFNDQQENAAMVNDLTGSKEHGRSFFATAMFILGAEIDRDHLMSFMLEQGLFGMQVFEHLLQNRDYCGAYYAFRRLERAFVGSLAEEEKSLKVRMDQFNAQFGAAPCDMTMFEASDREKARIDSHAAALDLLEALSFTPLGMIFSNSIAVNPTNCVRSMKTIARHFERFANGQKTKDQANLEIADHLLAFAQQFSAESKGTTSL